LIPAALIPLHNKKALEAFGPVPFDIVYARNKVFTRTVEPLDSTPEGGSNPENMTADVGTSEDQQLQELLDFLIKHATAQHSAARHRLKKLAGKIELCPVHCALPVKHLRH
jgi:hypothetical protein